MGGVWSDEAATDLVRAYVVPKAGIEGTPEVAASIAKYLADHVSGYKQLRGGVVFVGELPKSPTGKVLRRLLKDQGQESVSTAFVAPVAKL